MNFWPDLPPSSLLGDEAFPSSGMMVGNKKERTISTGSVWSNVQPVPPRLASAVVSSGTQQVVVTFAMRFLPLFLKIISNNFPIYDECHTQSGKVLAMPRRWTHKDDSKT